MWVIVVETDDTGTVTRYNCVETEVEAMRIVDRLHGNAPPSERIDEMQTIIDSEPNNVGQGLWATKEQNVLASKFQAAETFYAEITSPHPSCDDSLHLAKHWEADMTAKTVSFSKSKFDTYNNKMALEHLRDRRKELFVESDVNVLPDRWAAMSQADKDEWTTYRQALRDLPATVDINDWPNITWPEEPE